MFFYILKFIHTLQSVLDQRLDECKLGGWAGGSEEKLLGTFSKENCILAVKQQYPTANGVSWDYSCGRECNCYAEFGMSGSSAGADYYSCRFKGEQCCKL